MRWMSMKENDQDVVCYIFIWIFSFVHVGSYTRNFVQCQLFIGSRKLNVDISVLLK